MKKTIPETRYRASRICRALGNPTAYEVLSCLGEERMTPADIASALGVNIATISQVLRVLRNLDLVRYNVAWRHRHYWIKSGAVRRVMQDLERLVGVIGSES